MIARGLGHLAGKTANGVAERRAVAQEENRLETRAFKRVAITAIGWVPLGVCVWNLFLMQPGEDKTVWVAVAAGAAILFLVLLRRIGGTLGILGGAGLWLLSLGLLAGTVGMMLGFTATLARLLGHSHIEWLVIAGIWLGGGAIYLLCTAGISRVEQRA